MQCEHSISALFCSSSIQLNSSHLTRCYSQIASSPCYWRNDYVKRYRLKYFRSNL
ncbi:hypothetical protein V6Z11_A03G001100 [Gossypium hirsutum]